MSTSTNPGIAAPQTNESYLKSKKRNLEAAELSQQGVWKTHLTNINPHLKKLDVDHMYHLGLNTAMIEVDGFSDVRAVILCGSPERCKEVIKYCINLFQYPVPLGMDISPIGKTERYHIYKMGPVISVSHGIGDASILLVLHEITKLLMYAGAKDFVYIRVGTCGGLGIPAGTVVISTEALTSTLQPTCHRVSLGKERVFPTHLDPYLSRDIFHAAKATGLFCVEGKTIACGDFYEEQGRLDGFFCDFSETEQKQFLQTCVEAGVKNIEMESVSFACFCARAGIAAAMLCVTLVNRMEGDQVRASSAELKEYSSRAITAVGHYLSSTLLPHLIPSQSDEVKVQ